MARILLIDDDDDFRGFIASHLQQQGHEVVQADLAEDGLKVLGSVKGIQLILLDNKMPRMSGLEFLAALKKDEVVVPVILMTGAHSDRTVIQAMNLGAFAYLIKPSMSGDDLGDVQALVDQALEITRRPRPVAIRADEAPEEESAIIGKSKAIVEVLMRVGRFAQMDETVLILGETGTGKDLVARAIHTNGKRRDKPFVVMNCTALNENLLDDELFGHEAGAFTGAEKLRKGRFEHAHGGTLFLDEVGDMPMTLQAKLLRVLENREIVRIGSNEAIKVNVRVLAATHRDLAALVREGKFRQDLFYRLEGMTLRLPALRERKEDIDLLARCFLSRLFGAAEAPALDAATLGRLRGYSWPGNIRQLQKVLCRAAGVCRESQIMAEDIDFGELSAATDKDGGALVGLRKAVQWFWDSNEVNVWPLLQERAEQELLTHALGQADISQVQLARRLGMARNTLRARIEQYGLQTPPES